MHHIISIGMNAETLRQLDELRAIFPDALSRADIMKRLIAEAHARHATAAPPALKLAG